MRVECVALCDGASVREGLLHVLGAGVSGSETSAFPAGLQVTFAFRAILDTREAKQSHALHVALKSAIDERTLHETIVKFFRPDDAAPLIEEVALTTAIPLTDFVVASPGQYLVQATLDHTNIATLPLRVDRVEADEDDAPV